MSQCDKLDGIIDDIITGVNTNQQAIDKRMDDNIASPPSTVKRRTIWKKITGQYAEGKKKYGKTSTEKMDNAEFKKLYKGPDGERALLANKIEELLAQSDIRSFVFLDFLKKDMIKLNVWQMAKIIDGKPVLESLPHSYLVGLHERLWNFGIDKDWDKARLKRGNISHGRPFNLKWNDSSGGYAIMEDAVAQYPGAMYRDIQQFMKPNGKRFTKDGKPYGMNEVYRWAGETIDMLDSRELQAMKDAKGGIAQAKAYMVQFLTMYMNGWITRDAATGQFYIAAKYSTIEKQQKPGTNDWKNTYDQAVRYKGEPGRVVKNQGKGLFTIALDNGKLITNVNEIDLSMSDKSYIFTWDDFIPIEAYNPEIHGEAFTERYEYKMHPLVEDFLKAYTPINDKAANRLDELFIMVKGQRDRRGNPSFRGIHQEVYTWFNGVRDNRGKLALDKKGNEVYIGAMEESKRAINTAVMKWFVDPNGRQYDSRLVEQALRALWEIDYQPGPDVSEHLLGIVKELDTFTEFVMFESLFWDTLTMEEKDAFPIQYVTSKLTFQFDQFENRMNKERARAVEERDKAESGKRGWQDKIRSIDDKIEHAKWAKGRAADLTDDKLFDQKILARKDSVHAKHITNAFDPMEMRVDSEVYGSYLQNVAGIPARNFMTAKYIDSLRIIRRDKSVNPEAVELAVKSLYQGALGHPDTRGMFLGVDVSPKRMQQTFDKMHLTVPAAIIERNFKTLNRYYTGLLLNSFLTAAGNASQFVEKGMIFGAEVLFEMQDYYSEYKNDQGLQDLLSKADVTAFTDYFSQNMIGELQALEGARVQVIPAVVAMIKYRNDVEKGANEDVAFQRMKREVLRYLRTEIERGDVPQIVELTQRKKALDKQTRLERANKMANWAIQKDFSGAPPRGKWLKFKASFNRSARFLSQFQKDMAGLPTMAITEGATRSVSWLIGAELHRRLLGYQVPLYELIPTIHELEQGLIKGQKLLPADRSVLKKELKELKRQLDEYLIMGKHATRALDFDLEKALYSESSRTSTGKWAGLFGDFGKQRMEQEGQKAIAAYRSFKRPSHLGKIGLQTEITEDTDPSQLPEKTGKKVYSLNDKWRLIREAKFDWKAFFKVFSTMGKGMLPNSILEKISKNYVPTDVKQGYNPDAAILQRMGSIWAFTVAYNLLLGFGGGAVLSPLTNRILRKITGSHKLGNARSDLASLLVSPLVMLAYMTFFGDDDEDEQSLEKWWEDMLFSVPLIGVGGTSLVDAVMFFWGLSSGDVKEAWDKGGGDLLKLHFPKEVHPILDKVMEEEGEE